MDEKTTYRNSKASGWHGETKIQLGLTMQHAGAEFQRVLVISTSKTFNGRGIYSDASVRGENGSATIFSLGSDYQKRLERDVGARCTEKAVRLMHERALQQKDALVAEAKRFYAPRKPTADDDKKLAETSDRFCI